MYIKIARGVVIIEPWYTKANYKIGAPHMGVYQGKDIKIARAGQAKARNGVSVMDMHYLVSERGKKVKYFTSREELGMFEVSSVLRLMKKAGLRGRFLKRVEPMPNRGLFVGIKPR